MPINPGMIRRRAEAIVLVTSLLLNGWFIASGSWRLITGLLPAPPPITSMERIARDLECDSTTEADRETLEMSIDVANVTAGDHEYSEEVDANDGETVKYQVFVRNREVEQATNNLRVRLVADRAAFGDQYVEASVCGDGSVVGRDGATVRSNKAIRLHFVPGSVVVRTIENGQPAERVASDDFFKDRRGESIGRLRATPAGDETGNVFTMTALARVERVAN